MKTPLVLVVEDEGPIRKLIVAMLAMDGYEALEAEDGAEALPIAMAEPIDLLIADVVMPGISGPELITRLKDRGMAMRYLLTSGYSGDSLDAVHGISQRIPFLSKPFTASQLLSKVREVLGRESAWRNSPAGCSVGMTAAGGPDRPAAPMGLPWRLAG
jgi:two-component system, cell cycle sensor histidine kinase and response regulator CckA